MDTQEKRGKGWAIKRNLYEDDRSIVICSHLFGLTALLAWRAPDPGEKKTCVESEVAGKGRRGVVTGIETERAPGTTAEANPSIPDIEPSRVSPPQL